MEANANRYEDPVEYANSPPGFSPRQFLSQFLNALRRKWWIVLIAAILPIGPSLYYLQTRPVEYMSKSRMWVRGSFRMSEVAQFTEDVQNFYGTQIQLMQSPRIAQRAVDRLKTSNPDLPLPKDEQGSLRAPRIRVSQAPKGALFLLESYSSSAAYAQAYLDALMEEFLAYRKEVRAATSGDALASVSTQVYKQENELKVEQEKFTHFQRENNVALLEENLRGGGGQLSILNSQLAMLKLELQLLDAAAIEQSAGVAPRTNAFVTAADFGRVPGSSSSAASGIQADFLSARQHLLVLQADRDRLSRDLRPKHPKIIRLTEEIDRIENNIKLCLTLNQEQLTAAKDAMRLRIKSLETTIAELRERVGEANRKLADLDRIRAGIARAQSFYDRLLNLLQGVDLNSSMNQENVVILERADGARSSSKSTTLIMVAGPAFAGLAAGLGIIFLLARLDDRCDSLVEVRHHFAEQVFGQVPDVSEKHSNGHLPVLQIDDSRHIFAESCRSLRSSLVFGATNGHRPKAILVTSAAPDEGKSTIAINLATALAMGGSRVLMVDADLRRGHLHKLIGVAGEPGLIECVQRAGDLAQFAVATPLPNLSFLPCGKLTQTPEGLFLAPAFGNLMQRAREQYDYVVIDSIPVFAADDTTTLAPKTDGVLFIVRRGFTSAGIAQEALELLYQRQAKILGIVFNRADTSSRNYHFYKYAKYHQPNQNA